MAKWNKVGTLKKSKAGNLYIEISSGGVSLDEGAKLQLRDPRKSFMSLVSSGKLTREEAETKAAKIPEFVKYDIFSVEE